MDFVFHDDVLSFFFNVGSVFVWDFIKHLRCNNTSKPDQIIEHKTVEQPILNVVDTDVMLDDVSEDERILNTVNDDVDATVNTEDSISDNDSFKQDATGFRRK
ncbi:hypothetical protein CEXT_263111 [Caerostris extrusa]|uniref:Uncharacterized protein n=1 Tax=Caerostris extrusa TaxID=172846 RepID=A0AAV4XSS0_CAEEX|nr:hypothetical protein CEXT_263111 [Caerostris extrusa]